MGGPPPLGDLIRTVPDFPAPGIVFRDVTTLLAHGAGFAASIDALATIAAETGAEAIAGIEARGFVFGAATAAASRLPFLMLRKVGKLPVPALGVDYALEYGHDRLELDPSTISAGQRVLLVDDLLATGGTATAGVDLLRQAGAAVTVAAFVVALPDLDGAARLQAQGVTSRHLVTFAGG